MNRPGRILVVVGLCLAVVLAAMGWMTLRLVQLDRAESEALAEAALEESVRLSLWRMDSALAPLVARESARPYFVYDTSYPAYRARSLLAEAALDNDTPLPSPLLTEPPPFVLLYFQVDGDGVVTSPQVPGTDADQALAVGVAPDEALVGWSDRLGQLQGWLDTRAVAAALDETEGEQLLALRVPESSRTVTRYQPVTVRTVPPENAPTPVAEATTPEPATPPPVGNTGDGLAEAELDRNVNPSNMMQVQRAQELVQQGNEAGPQAAAPAQVASNRYNRGGGGRRGVVEPQVATPEPQVPDAQQMLNAQEFVERASFGNETVVFQQSAVNYHMPSSELVTGFVIPLWVDDQLLLVRRVTVDGEARIQGCWLDWPAMERWLLAEVADLLPDAALEPVPHDVADEHGRLLASIPVRLAPGALEAVAAPAATPIQSTLAVAWAAVAIAVVAVIVMVIGVVTLSERRAAFVSAVTHEMRTPLTTFRMYSEMLAEGMVTPEKRQRYLETLQREADRLGHLVDNVLAYARLEGRRSRSRLATVGAEELLGHVRSRLSDRASQADMGLQIEVEEAAREQSVRADLSAAEQILLNLVDNACKYAATAEDRTLSLSLATGPRGLRIRVRDHGPGIDAALRRRLFRPFSKSAKEAAHSAPGVGLGLALSRRLAREMGGDLRLDEAVRDGAAFELTLVRA